MKNIEETTERLITLTEAKLKLLRELLKGLRLRRLAGVGYTDRLGSVRTDYKGNFKVSPETGGGEKTIHRSQVMDKFTIPKP